MPVSWKKISRAVAWTGLVLLVIYASLMTGWAVSAQRSLTDANRTLSRRSPSTDWQAASAAHTDCRKNLEDAWFAKVNAAIDPTIAAADRLQAAADRNKLGDQLAHIEDHCPTPRPPIFDAMGKLVSPPVIPDQYVPCIRPTPPDTPPVVAC